MKSRINRPGNLSPRAFCGSDKDVPQGPAAGQGRAGAQGGDQQVLQIPPGETLGGENAGGGAPGFLEQTQQQVLRADSVLPQQQVFAAYVIMSQALGQGPGGS